MSRNRAGFTLIELLVVIAIIAILAAILFPVLNAARQKGQGASCLSSMRQIGIAHRMYMDDDQEVLVPLIIIVPGAHGVVSGWNGYLLWYDNLAKYNRSGKILNCPAKKQWALGMNHPQLGRFIGAGAGYQGRGAAGGICKLSDIDHPVRTVVFADTGWVANYSEQDPDKWVENPRAAEYYAFRTPDNDFYGEAYYSVTSPYRIYNRHSGTANCCFMDGHAEACRVSKLGFQYGPSPGDPRAQWDIY